MPLSPVFIFADVLPSTTTLAYDGNEPTTKPKRPKSNPLSSLMDLRVRLAAEQRDFLKDVRERFAESARLPLESRESVRERVNARMVTTPPKDAADAARIWLSDAYSVGDVRTLAEYWTLSRQIDDSLSSCIERTRGK